MFNKLFTIGMLAAGIAGATTSQAEPLAIYAADQIPDARAIAAILNPASAPAPLRLRGVRLSQPAGATPETATAAATPQQPQPAAPRVDCAQRAGQLNPGVVTRQAATIAGTNGTPLKIRGIRVANVTAAAAVATVGEPDCAPALIAAAIEAPVEAIAAPTLPAPAPAPGAVALVLQFGADSVSLAPSAHAQLDALARGIRLAGAQFKLVIEGHTDATGEEDYNLLLSYRRAQAVKAYLVEHAGFEADLLRVSAAGESAPIDPSNPHAPENRRVEFRVLN